MDGESLRDGTREGRREGISHVYREKRETDRGWRNRLRDSMRKGRREEMKATSRGGKEKEKLRDTVKNWTEKRQGRRMERQTEGRCE